MVTALSLFGLAIYFLATAAIGQRLLRLWYRTRELPELTTGVGYIAGGALGWSLVLAGHEPSVVNTTLGLILRTCAVFFLSLGSLSVGLGIWRIFRPERKWASGVCLLLGLVLVVDLARNAVIERTPFVPGDTFWYWPGAIARGIPFLWMPFESLRYYGLLRRRQKLGLAEPLIVNRFAMWTVSGFTTLLTVLVAVGSAGSKTDVVYPNFFLATYAVLGVTGAGTLWLAFFPPRRYAEAIERRAASEGGA